ncbi:flagellar biosynthetic protein FliO [Phenylobacterium sp.]|uniref:flagellar biosynthetic protein FliO n=1 Tax=Phenylobacterium sp. TaxID=1871053 RepID=UPI00272F4A6A|nr:flagellar biosynthetic protein FliO [Phenylobacterium sp.]MDP1616918.1 flagellar biosynthetic protein FliO [Phenylobacterium sp.]MDP1987406.1 flagellar biosynthetic protein FliO [Phenylobacterium sp.]
MDFASFARAVFALAITVGLIGLAAVAMRRFGPDVMSRLAPHRAERRLAVVETLVLDPSRRLVLVSCDGDEKLLLLGEGQVLTSQPVSPAAVAATPTSVRRKASKPKPKADA